MNAAPIIRVYITFELDLHPHTKPPMESISE
jgi:hypothetical protein